MQGSLSIPNLQHTILHFQCMETITSCLSLSTSAVRSEDSGFGLQHICWCLQGHIIAALYSCHPQALIKLKHLTATQQASALQRVIVKCRHRLLTLTLTSSSAKAAHWNHYRSNDQLHQTGQQPSQYTAHSRQTARLPSLCPFANVCATRSYWLERLCILTIRVFLQASH